MREIANRKLTLADIPGATADWGAIGEFALTFNGYKAWQPSEKCADIANACPVFNSTVRLNPGSVRLIIWAIPPA